MGDAGDVIALGRAAQRIALAVADAEALVDIIEMGVDMDDMDRRFAVEGADAGDMHRVVAAQDDRQCPGCEHLPHAVFDIVEALQGIDMDHVGIADIDDADLVAGEEQEIVLRIVGALADGEELRGVAESLRPEARAGADLGAEVEGRAHDGDIGVDGVPVRLVRLLHEGRNADEGEIEPGAFRGVGRVRHGQGSLAGRRHSNLAKPKAYLYRTEPKPPRLRSIRRHFDRSGAAA